MKRSRSVLLIVLCVLMLGGCREATLAERRKAQADRTETTELLAFYGESRFLILGDDTGAPIAGATLQVDHLPIEERRDEERRMSDEEGHIVIHQIHRLDSYTGEGPPRPVFTFSAPNYQTLTLSVDDFASASGYDPYFPPDSPTTEFTYSEDEDPIELPVYEFTIRLVRID